MFGFEIQEGVAVLRLEEAGDVGALLARLDEVFARVAGTEGLRAVILTGAGERAFCDWEAAMLAPESVHEVCGRIESSPVPVIAAINGTAKGLGVELARACHIRMASEGAEISGFNGAPPAGFLNRVVEPGQLMPEALALAREIARLAPLAITACLVAVTRGLALPFDEGLRLETALFSSLFSTEDMREGTLAFLEKRAPVFKGR